MTRWIAAFRRAASASISPIWWRSPSTSTTQVRRWAGSPAFGLAEGGGDDLAGVAGDRAGQPLGGRVRPAPHFALAAAPAGHGDHIVRPAGGWGRVVDAGQGGHPLAARFLPRGQPRAEDAPAPVLARGGPAGGPPQSFGPHHDALAVRAEHRQHLARARLVVAGGTGGACAGCSGRRNRRGPIAGAVRRRSASGGCTRLVRCAPTVRRSSSPGASAAESSPSSRPRRRRSRRPARRALCWTRPGWVVPRIDLGQRRPG